MDPFSITDANATFICISECPTATVMSTPANAFCAYGVKPTNAIELAAQVNIQRCSPYKYSSISVLNRCIPNAPIDPSFFNTTVSAGNTTISISSLINSGREEVC